MAETIDVRFKECNFVFIQTVQLCVHFPKIVELIAKIVRRLRPLLYDSKNATSFSFSQNSRVHYQNCQMV